jgi:hypothetical protein
LICPINTGERKINRKRQLQTLNNLLGLRAI